EIVTIAMIVAADLAAVEKLAGGFQIGFLVRALSGKSKIFSLDERQEHRASAEVHFLHAARSQFTRPGHGDVAHSHEIRPPPSAADKAARAVPGLADRRSCGHPRGSPDH